MAKDPTEIIRQRDAEVAKIRGYADLTEEAKNRRIAEVRERAQAAYAEAREADARARAGRLESSKRAVFRVPVSPTATDAEAAQIHASYRAAFNDGYSATSGAEGPAQAQEELGRILGQADRTGDKLLAAATYHRGIDLGVQEVVDSYLATRPAEAGAWESYTAAHQEDAEARGVGGLIGRALMDRAMAGAAGGESGP